MKQGRQGLRDDLGGGIHTGIVMADSVTTQGESSFVKMMLRPPRLIGLLPSEIGRRDTSRFWKKQNGISAVIMFEFTYP
jgi:hypothetical protein